MQNINSMLGTCKQEYSWMVCDKTKFPYPSGQILLSISPNTAQGRPYKRITAWAHSPRNTEAATTLSVGDHLMKICTSGWLMESCGGLLPVMVWGGSKTGPAHFVLGWLCCNNQLKNSIDSMDYCQFPIYYPLYFNLKYKKVMHKYIVAYEM